MRLSRLAAAAAVALCVWGPVSAGALVDTGDAPAWRVSEWINADPGTLASHKGRVVAIHFFQLWCPGCNNFTIPLFQRWDELWGSREDFLTVSIHTVFEGHDYQTVERLREFVSERGIWHPVGVDSYAKKNDEVPITMQLFENTGTPQVAIVDKEGQLVFNHFGSFDPTTVEFLIERLLKENTEHRPAPKPKLGRNEQASGLYKMRFEQKTKSCGDLRNPWNGNMTLDVFSDKMHVNFQHKVMGVSSFTAQFNSRSLRFNATLNRTDPMQGAEVELVLTIDGRFVKSSQPPRLEFEATFTRTGGAGGTDCEIRGSGSAQRIGE